MTGAERTCESRLKNAKVSFKAQIIVGLYIVDFCLPDRLVAIEIDGGYHLTDSQRRYDEMRDLFLRECGLSIIRIPNDHVRTYNLRTLLDVPVVPLQRFRRVLSRANVFRGRIMHKGRYN